MGNTADARSGRPAELGYPAISRGRQGARRANHRDHRRADWQILTAAAAAAGLKKSLSPHWLRQAHGSHAHRRGAPAAIRDTLRHASLSTTDLYLGSAPMDGSSLCLKF